MHYGEIKDARRAVGMTNRLLGWVNLVDSNGKIRWQAHGFAKDHEIETLINGAHQLIREFDSRPPNSKKK
jgi:hypothetical protein